MIVIDTSVVIKWIKQDEKDRDIAIRIYQEHLNNKVKIIVPQLLFIEAANVLVTKSSFSSSDIRNGLEFIYDMNLSIHKVEKEEISLASILARKYKTSIYDMLYAVVAQRHKTVLVTADEKFCKATQFPHVKLLSSYTTPD